MKTFTGFHCVKSVFKTLPINYHFTLMAVRGEETASAWSSVPAFLSIFEKFPGKHPLNETSISWKLQMKYNLIKIYIAQCNGVCVNRNDIIKHAFLEYTVMIFLRNLYCHHFTIHGFKCNNINLIKVSVKEAAMRSRFMPLRRRYKLGNDSRRWK